MYVLGWWDVYAHTRMLFWYLYPKLQSNDGNEQQNNNLPWVHNYFALIHALVCFLQDIIYPFIEGILPNGPYPLCLRMADRTLLAGYPRHDDGTTIPTPRIPLFMLCWLRHDLLTMTCQHKKMWKELVNALDIDFIHGHIDAWSCKNASHLTEKTTRCHANHIHSRHQGFDLIIIIYVTTHYHSPFTLCFVNWCLTIACLLLLLSHYWLWTHVSIG